ncbi:MAG: hypothetical protein BGO12_21340 [Verrucomicrobia bacterium 61-8]|nr:MAG: hypothetical protein BGO12_21340 [Verrucomicrobia bacterium 61-8]
MKPYGIKRKVICGFGCVIAIVSIQGIIELVHLRKIQNVLTDSYTISWMESRAAGEMTQYALDLRAAIQAVNPGAVEKGFSGFKSALVQAGEATTEARDLARQRGRPEEAKAEEADLTDLDRLSVEFQAMEKAWRELTSQSVSPDPSSAILPAFDSVIIPGVRRYEAQSIREMESSAALARELLKTSNIYLILATLGAIIAAAIAGIFLSRTILRPLRSLTNAAREAAKGNLDVRLSKERNDEFGLLAHTFNTMLDSLRDNMVTRDQLEAVIADRTRELDQFFQLSPDLLCIADFSGKFRRVNQAFTTVLGYPEKDFLERPFLDFIHPDDLEKTQKVMADFQSSGSPVRHFENRYRHMDGSWRTLSWQALPILESGIIFAAARDVSDIQLAQQRLRESEEYNRTIVESADDCLKVLTLDGHVFSVSEHGLKLLEIEDASQIRDADWLAFWNGADHENAVRAVEQARSGLSGRFQGYCPTLKGTPKWWDVIISPIRGLSGEPVRLLAVSRDISQRKKIEDELRNLNSTLQERVEERTQELLVNESRFRLMIDSIKDYAIFMLGPDGTVATWNSGAKRIKGYSSTEIIGQHFSCFYTLEDISAGLPQRLLRKAETEGTSYHEGWRARKDGSLFWAGVDLTAIRDESGDLKGFAKVTRDLTERRNADSALREALAMQTELTRKAQAGENAKSEFLAIMSHELRTPMHGILGYSDLLVNSQDLTGDNRAYAETLSHCSRSLLRILDDILDFSSAQNGTLQIEKSSFSPRSLLREIQTLLEPTASEKGLTFAISISPRLPDPLIADPGRLRQILLNLVGNAIKFTPAGTITLEANRGDDHSKSTWEIIVRDTGTGIPEEMREKIFEPFMQIDRGMSRKFGGTGLGLSIARKLAEIQGGTLISRASINGGAEFILTLPLEIAPKTSLPETVKSNAVPTRLARQYPLRILVVDDDRINRKLMLTIIRKLGYTAASAANGREAVETYLQVRPDCVLMDLQMPEMDQVGGKKQSVLLSCLNEDEAGADPTHESLLLYSFLHHAPSRWRQSQTTA